VADACRASAHLIEQRHGCRSPSVDLVRLVDGDGRRHGHLLGRSTARHVVLFTRVFPTAMSTRRSTLNPRSATFFVFSRFDRHTASARSTCNESRNATRSVASRTTAQQRTPANYIAELAASATSSSAVANQSFVTGRSAVSTTTTDHRLSRSSSSPTVTTACRLNVFFSSSSSSLLFDASV
jgi:hypothetical protein